MKIKVSIHVQLRVVINIGHVICFADYRSSTDESSLRRSRATDSRSSPSVFRFKRNEKRPEMEKKRNRKEERREMIKQILDFRVGQRKHESVGT